MQTLSSTYFPSEPDESIHCLNLSVQVNYAGKSVSFLHRIILHKVYYQVYSQYIFQWAIKLSRTLITKCHISNFSLIKILYPFRKFIENNKCCLSYYSNKDHASMLHQHRYLQKIDPLSLRATPITFDLKFDASFSSSPMVDVNKFLW